MMIAYVICCYDRMFSFYRELEVNVICDKCKGGKEILGLGMFYVSCPKCGGVGFVFKEDKKAETKENIVNKKSIDDALQSQILKKSTRGRKKKVDKL